MDFLGRSDRGPRWSGDAGAGQLFAAVRDACAGGEDLPSRLEAGLRAAFDMLAADPELARRLTLWPGPDEGESAFEARREWIGRFGDLLSGAVAGDPRTTSSAARPLLAAFLIGGVCFQVARLVIRAEGDELPRLLPGTLEVLLAFYFEPGEARDLALAALGESD
jgi:hypothetical protein